MRTLSEEHKKNISKSLIGRKRGTYHEMRCNKEDQNIYRKELYI